MAGPWSTPPDAPGQHVLARRQLREVACIPPILALQYVLLMLLFSGSPSYSPRFFFAQEVQPREHEWLRNETLRIMHSNGLKVLNLHVFNSFTHVGPHPMTFNVETNKNVMGYWFKQMSLGRTDIRLSSVLQTRPAMLYVLSHELAHEYHYQCSTNLQFVLNRLRQKESFLEMYVDLLGMFMLARTCQHDPSTTLQGFLDINGPATHSREYKQLERNMGRVLAYRALFCTQESPSPPQFDHTLCPGSALFPSVSV